MSKLNILSKTVMQNKISTRKKQFVSLFILMIFSSVFAVSSLIPSSLSAAAGPGELIFYVTPNANKNKLKEFFKGEKKPSGYTSELNQTSILASNVLGNNEEFVMKYDSAVTDRFGDDDGEVFYTQTYYCGATNVSAQADGTNKNTGWKINLDGEPEDSVATYAITYTVGFRARDPNIISSNEHMGSVHAGISYITQPGGETIQIGGGGQGPIDLGPNNASVIPDECRPKVLGTQTALNYYKLSDAQKAKYASLVSKAKAQSEALETETASGDEANCEGGGALGWIICPVSELIANFATDMFEDVIAPMLENVPISLKRTGEDSGGFQAWQSMRAIANALLVISLLAVVYSQAKGGD